MPSGLREARVSPPEGEPQFPPHGPAQHHLSQAESVKASRYGPSGKQGPGGGLTGRRQYILLCSMHCSLCSLRFRLHPAFAPVGSTLRERILTQAGVLTAMEWPGRLTLMQSSRFMVTAFQALGAAAACTAPRPSWRVSRGGVSAGFPGRGRRRRRRFPHL